MESQTASAESSVAEQRFQEARALLHGDGVPKDVKKSFELMKATADQGHPEAMGSLGYFYSTGTAVPKDLSQATEWFRKGAEKGSAKAGLNLGKFLIDGRAGDSSDEAKREGGEWIRKAADQGLPEAALSYGSMLYFGDHGQSRDYEKAAVYLKIAAEGGSADAQNLVGNMAELGLGVPVDQKEAEGWFRKASMQGNARAQANLGRLIGVQGENRESRVEAVAWVLLANSQGEPTSEKVLQEAVPHLKEGDMEAARAKAMELRQMVSAKPRK